MVPKEGRVPAARGAASGRVEAVHRGRGCSNAQRAGKGGERHVPNFPDAVIKAYFNYIWKQT